MEYIQRLPLILGCVAAIVAGTISYALGNSNQIIYLRMAVVMLVFFIIGIYIKRTILRLKNEIDKKKEEEKRKQMEIAEAERIAKKAAERQKNNTHKIDLTAGDSDDLGDSSRISNDDFEPLTASKAIKSQIKSDQE